MSIGKCAQAVIRPVSVLVLTAVLVGGVAASVSAGEVDDWAKEADKTLRGAERLMFNGKNAEALEQLNAAGALLKKIEEADAGHKNLKTLRNKYEKLQKDLARRMGTGEPASGAAPAAADKPKADKPATLPYPVREAMKEFQDTQRAVESSYRMIENSKTMELSKSVEDYYADIEKLFPALEAALKKVREVAAEKGVESHPDLDEAQAYIDAQPERLSQVKAEMAAFLKEKAAKEAEEKAKAQEAAGPAIDVAQAQEDWKALAALCEEYQSNFLSETDVKKKGVVIHTAWEDWKKRFEPVRTRFRERYGDTNLKVYDVFEKVPNLEDVEMPAVQAANVAYGIDFAERERQIAGWAQAWAKDALRVSDSIAADNKEKLELKYARAEGAVKYYKLAQLWNPDGKYDEAIQKAEAAAAAALPLWKTVLKELTWPGHNKDYAGPGKPDEIAKAVLEFLKENPKWSAREYDDEHLPYAACVEGKDWEIWKRAPLTQEPTQYSLDVLVAFEGKADPELVYVYHMVIYTAEAAGVKPGLPIKHANSKLYACYRMLKSNVPKPK
jgi:hypothetical protein